MPIREIRKLGDRMADFYERFQRKLQTKTRDTSKYGLRYMSGLLRMETNRNITNVGRKTEVSRQNLQHFISNSTWSGLELIEAVQDEIKVHYLSVEEATELVASHLVNRTRSRKSHLAKSKKNFIDNRTNV